MNKAITITLCVNLIALQQHDLSLNFYADTLLTCSMMLASLPRAMPHSSPLVMTADPSLTTIFLLLARSPLTAAIFLSTAFTPLLLPPAYLLKTGRCNIGAFSEHTLCDAHDNNRHIAGFMHQSESSKRWRS